MSVKPTPWAVEFHSTHCTAVRVWADDVHAVIVEDKEGVWNASVWREGGFAGRPQLELMKPQTPFSSLHAARLAVEDAVGAYLDSAKHSNAACLESLHKAYRAAACGGASEDVLRPLQQEIDCLEAVVGGRS